MAETKETPAPLHVVVFPWLAFGHIIPFLELSQQLAKRGHAVTFVSTARNVARLSPIPPELAPRIRLVSLPLPAVDGLPGGAESTADLPPEKVELLKLAFDGFAGPFAGFLAGACAGGGEGSGTRPDWIILDFAHHWLPPIANEHKVPCALFMIFPAATIASRGPVRSFEAAWMAQASEPNASGISDISRHVETAKRCRLVVFRTSEEVEGPLCPALSNMYGKPVVPSGLLAPYDAANAALQAGPGGGGDDDAESGGVMRWLGSQPERSVLYVAFGSEAPLTPAHVRELARGLELAGVRFLWALRSAAAELLPDGFEERVAGRGVVRAGWVPQVRVLAHGAVGAFMTHAGWSSIVEALLFGHPMVMLPLCPGQNHAARTVEEALRAGLEVPRDDGDGSFTAEDVAATVRRVMAAEEEEGKALARNAMALREVVSDRARQERYVDELVEHLVRRHND
ncbi:hypothetical protein ACP70R_002456 [Stipagrostis hirtigluma subsp. patula]